MFSLLPGTLIKERAPKALFTALDALTLIIEKVPKALYTALNVLIPI